MRKVTRERILKEHGNRCAKCGAMKCLEIDHIIPVSKGGKENESNMQVLCKTCNLKKGNKIDYSQFFIINESPEYIAIASEFMSLSLSAKEQTNVIKMMFDQHAKLWNITDESTGVCL